MNDNENTTMQYLWDAAKKVLRGKFIVKQAFLEKKISNQQHKLPPKKNQKKRTKKNPKVSRRKEIIKIREEINKIEIHKTIGKKINKTKSWLFEWVNKIDKLLARLTKNKEPK